MGASESTSKEKGSVFDDSICSFAEVVKHCNVSVSGSDRSILGKNKGKDVSRNPLEDYTTFRLYVAQLNSLIVKNMPFLKA